MVLGERPPDRSTVLLIFPASGKLLLLVVILHHVLGDRIQRHFSKRRSKMGLIGGQIAGVGGRLTGGRRLIQLQPLKEGILEQRLSLGEMPETGSQGFRIFGFHLLLPDPFLDRGTCSLPLLFALLADRLCPTFERLAQRGAVLFPADGYLVHPGSILQLIVAALAVCSFSCHGKTSNSTKIEDLT